MSNYHSFIVKLISLKNRISVHIKSERKLTTPSKVLVRCGLFQPVAFRKHFCFLEHVLDRLFENGLLFKTVYTGQLGLTDHVLLRLCKLALRGKGRHQANVGKFTAFFGTEKHDDGLYGFEKTIVR